MAKSFGYAMDEDSDDETTAQTLAKKEMDALKQDHYQLIMRDPQAKK
jgi:sulfur relay (sulfurtransferase) DsrC/TusE family protein